MTRLLGKAFEQASKLPTKDQDELARWILEELASEERWSKAFADSQDELSKLAAEIREERRKGKTQPFDPDRL
jgi:hypothetical protein